jgi:hypothetical protein
MLKEMTKLQRTFDWNNAAEKQDCTDVFHTKSKKVKIPHHTFSISKEAKWI